MDGSRHSANSSYVNDAYGGSDESDVESSTGRVMKKKIQRDEEMDIIEDIERDTDRQRANSLPNNGTSTHDSDMKAPLEGIPEEMSPFDRSIINMGFDNMSLSNFKVVQGDNHFPKNPEKRFQGSYDSAIQMRTLVPEHPIHTGPNFRKTSACVITPTVNLAGQRQSSMIDCIKFLDNPNVPELFIEFDSLQFNVQSRKCYWVERFRWLRFEEYYNPELCRFDSPHLSPLSIEGISNFRKLFSKGQALLDCHEVEFVKVLKSICDSMSSDGAFTEAEMKEIQNALILRHFHAGESVTRRNSTKTSYRYDDKTDSFQHELDQRSKGPSIARLGKRHSHIKLDSRLLSGTEALSVHVGALETLEHTFSLFVRLDPPIKADGLNEVNCPLRFIFIIFGPKSREEELLEIGRVFAVMMSNLEFREVGYSANDKDELIDATKSFINHSVLVPLNKFVTHDALAGMMPLMKHYAAMFQAKQNQRVLDEIRKNKYEDISTDHFENGIQRNIQISAQMFGQVGLSSNLDSKSSEKFSGGSEKKRRHFSQFCPPLRHFFMDWQGLKSRYFSDFVDAFRRENYSMVFIGIVFIYFVVLSPAITFGALLNVVNPKMTVSLLIVASGFYQFFYTMLSGQPLEVVGITGPVFVVEKVLGSIAVSFQLELEVMRFWIGIYLAVLGLLFTIFNGVIIIKHFRRSVEEVYNFFVAAIYILSAFFTMFRNLPYYMTPININGTNVNVIVKERLKFGIGGTTLFLAFFMANFCIILVKIKRGSFFRRQIRNLLGSFNVPLGILLIIAMDKIFFRAYSMPTLNVPPSNVVNVSLWFNAPNFGKVGLITPEAHGFCFLISISLFAILITEVSTNSISITKTERKLLKPSLFSLNYFYILVIFPVISAITGWPFVSGAMVRSNAHCLAMSKWSLNLPGMPSKVTGAVEQRVSGLIVGLMVFLSVFLGSVLQYIPMAAMYGMFLYMGIMGVRDLVFMRRLISILQLRKYWSPEEFLKDYPTWNIGILISIQGIFIGILVILNCISEFTSYAWVTLIFPVFVALYAALRGYVLPKWPRLNSHLSKMDKKHPVKLYADQQALEQLLLTVDETGVNMMVIKTDSQYVMAHDNDNFDNSDDSESEFDKFW